MALRATQIEKTPDYLHRTATVKERMSSPGGLPLGRFGAMRPLQSGCASLLHFDSRRRHWPGSRGSHGARRGSHGSGHLLAAR